MAIVVIVLGVVVSTPFHILVREKPVFDTAMLKWHNWLTKPEFYMVSILYTYIYYYRHNFTIILHILYGIALVSIILLYTVCIKYVCACDVECVF